VAAKVGHEQITRTAMENTRRLLVLNREALTVSLRQSRLWLDMLVCFMFVFCFGFVSPDGRNE
jgi:hypothetical protein